MTYAGRLTAAASLLLTTAVLYLLLQWAVGSHELRALCSLIDARIHRSTSEGTPGLAGRRE
jgi:hypothetical protein